MDSVIPQSLDDYFSTRPIGSVERAVFNNIYGINHRQIAGAVPINKDSYGLTFFTRPQLNLQSDNIRNIRLFYPLLSELPATVQRFVRCTLDPRLMTGYSFDGKVISSPLPCPLVDNTQAFIPILTNHLNSLSGWPDIVAPVYSSEPGLYEQSFIQVDGTVKNFKVGDITATFRNSKGDPILYLFYIWIWYQSLVFEGLLQPYVDHIAYNRIDYMTRVYRLVLDESKRYVRKIAATGVSFPTTLPVGQFFDFSSEKPFNDQTKDISIQLKTVGFQYFDDILIKEFNETVCMFNTLMDDTVREDYMVKVHPALLVYFNNRGYPRINPSDYELEWWVDSTMFSTKAAKLLEANLIDPIFETMIETNYGD